MTTRHSWTGLFSVLALFGSPLLARANDVKDEVQHDANDVKRTVKKGGHRVSESACTASRPCVQLAKARTECKRLETRSATRWTKPKPSSDRAGEPRGTDRSPSFTRRYTMLLIASSMPVLAAGWSLLYLLCGGGIGGALIIFFGLKLMHK